MKRTSISQGQPTRRDITEGLIALGARQGDVLYLRCGFAPMGIRRSEIEDVFLGGVLDAIGPRGTVIAPAFVPQGFIFGNVPYSHPDTPPYTGALSAVLLGRPGAYRSTHPTHSFVGIGAQAEEVLRHHPADGACFEPIRRLVEQDGLMAVFGCVESCPGFSTLHLAQYDLGLSQRHYTKWFWTVRLPNGKLFRKAECPGCSDNAALFYNEYRKAGVFSEMMVGNADAAAIRAKPAYKIDRALLSDDPHFFLCERPDCLSCRTLRGYNKRAIPGALVHRAKQTAIRAVVRYKSGAHHSHNLASHSTDLVTAERKLPPSILRKLSRWRVLSAPK